MEEQGVDPSPSSTSRLDRGNELLDAQHGALSLRSMELLFADGVGDLNGICRDDTDGISTNGAVIVEPESRTIRACHGLPTEAGDTSKRARTQ